MMMFVYPRMKKLKYLMYLMYNIIINKILKINSKS
jgi:hypothetical protein